MVFLVKSKLVTLLHYHRIYVVAIALLFTLVRTTYKSDSFIWLFHKANEMLILREKQQSINVFVAFVIKQQQQKKDAHELHII